MGSCCGFLPAGSAESKLGEPGAINQLPERSGTLPDARATAGVWVWADAAVCASRINKQDRKATANFPLGGIGAIVTMRRLCMVKLLTGGEATGAITRLVSRAGKFRAI